IGRISRGRYTRRSISAASQSVNVIGTAQLGCNSIENVRGVAESSQQQKRPACSTPIEHFKLHVTIDSHELYGVRRRILPLRVFRRFSKLERQTLWTLGEGAGNRGTVRTQCSFVGNIRCRDFEFEIAILQINGFKRGAGAPIGALVDAGEFAAPATVGFDDSDYEAEFERTHGESTLPIATDIGTVLSVGAGG